MEFPNKTKNRNTQSSRCNIPVYLEHPKSTHPTDTHISMFTEALFAKLKYRASLELCQEMNTQTKYNSLDFTQL